MKLYTVKEVAEILRVSKRTIYSYIDAGYLRAIQVGEKKAIRIPEEAVYEFVTRNQTTLFTIEKKRKK